MHLLEADRLGGHGGDAVAGRSAHSATDLCSGQTIRREFYQTKISFHDRFVLWADHSQGLLPDQDVEHKDQCLNSNNPLLLLRFLAPRSPRGFSYGVLSWWSIHIHSL